MTNGEAMPGPETDPMKAFVDPPQPRKNQWEDIRDDPSPATAPLGPTVVGVLPSPGFLTKYTNRDATFLGKVRTGNFSDDFNFY